MQNDITIPLELLNGRYSLEEIATMIILFASPHLSVKTREYWCDNESCNRITDRLAKEGIIIFHDDDRIEIDIQETQPQQ